MKVLIVDDDEGQRYLVRLVFERAGVDSIHEAADGTDAVAAAAEVRPDLILLDLAMPVASGSEVLPELHRVSTARIVVLSHLPRRRLERLTATRGAVAYVEKATPAVDLFDEVMLAAGLAEAANDGLALANRFDADPSSPRSARAFVASALAAAGLGHLVDTVTLLTSELVTNAVVHGGGDSQVEVRLSTGRVRVEVFDRNPVMPVLRPPAHRVESGLGVALVDRLASRWGVRPTDDGKVVWFEVGRARQLPDRTGG